MKRILITSALALVIGAVVPATQASAAPASSQTTYYWSAQKAANTVANSTLTWNDGHTETPEYARCLGFGPRYRGLYRLFNCYIETDEDDPQVIRVVPTGPNTFRFSFIRYA